MNDTVGHRDGVGGPIELSPAVPLLIVDWETNVLAPLVKLSGGLKSLRAAAFKNTRHCVITHMCQCHW